MKFLSKAIKKCLQSPTTKSDGQTTGADDIRTFENDKIRMTTLGDGSLNVLFEVLDNKQVIASEVMEVAHEALAEIAINHHDKKTVLDVGAGSGNQANILKALGFEVTTLDPCSPSDINEDVLEAKIDQQYDIVFCSHVVEHQRNIGLFLDRLIELCKPDGLLCISVPPEVIHYFLLCHPAQFNGGLLLYHLILAGIDCRNAKVLTYGYNVSVIVENKKNGLRMQSFAHELDALPYFPSHYKTDTKQLFGPVKSLNWKSRLNEDPHCNAGL